MDVVHKKNSQIMLDFKSLGFRFKEFTESTISRAVKEGH